VGRVEILKRVLDSRDFSVGGGSAAALSGGLGAALVAMVARLSEGRYFGPAEVPYADIADQADDLSRALVLGAEEDAEAYGLVKEAYSLPQSTEEARLQRRAGIKKSLTVAATVPRDNALRCLRVKQLCGVLEGRSNPRAGSDLAVARWLAHAALLGCVCNIEVNALAMEDSQTAAAFREEADRLRESSGPVAEWREQESEA
jgi:methenyltetrahydrofolate cyclohydrolase